MKVLHINTFDKGGGAEDFAYDFVHNTSFDSKLMVLKKNSASDLVIQLDEFPIDKLLRFLDKVLYKLSIKKTLRQLLSLTEIGNFTFKKLRKNPAYREAEIIHLHNIHGGFFDIGGLVKIAREKKIVWTLHDMWALTGGEAYTFGNENFKKGIAYTPFKNIYPLMSPWIDLRKYYLNKKKKVYKKISDNTVFVADAKWLEREFAEAYVFNSSLKVKTIYCGIDTKRFYNKNKRTWGSPRVLIVNSKNVFKGSEIFKKVFPQITADFELYVIGDDIQFKHNASAVKHFPYFENRESLNDVFNDVDILIFPSHAEICPLTILIAMSCGVCVVSSDVGGIPELFFPDVGILFEKKNADELTRKLNKSLRSLQDVRETGRKASLKAKENYDVDHMYLQYKNLYEDLLIEKI